MAEIREKLERLAGAEWADDDSRRIAREALALLRCGHAADDVVVYDATTPWMGEEHADAEIGALVVGDVLAAVNTYYRSNRLTEIDGANVRQWFPSLSSWLDRVERDAETGE